MFIHIMLPAVERSWSASHQILLLPLQAGNAMYLVLQHTWSVSLPSNCGYEGREFLEQRWQVGISPHVSWGNVHQDVNTGLSFYYGPVK